MFTVWFVYRHSDGYPQSITLRGIDSARVAWDALSRHDCTMISSRP